MYRTDVVAGTDVVVDDTDVATVVYLRGRCAQVLPPHAAIHAVHKAADSAVNISASARQNWKNVKVTLLFEFMINVHVLPLTESQPLIPTPVTLAVN
jgi:hypothetical protein